MSTHIPSLEQLKRAAKVAEQIAKLEAELQSILSSGKPRGRKAASSPISVTTEAKPRKKRARNISPEARARIAEAQKARWAKFRKEQKA